MFDWPLGAPSESKDAAELQGASTLDGLSGFESGQFRRRLSILLLAAVLRVRLCKPPTARRSMPLAPTIAVRVREHDQSLTSRAPQGSYRDSHHSDRQAQRFGLCFLLPLKPVRPSSPADA